MNLRQSIESSISEFQTRIRILGMQKDALEMQQNKVQIELAQAYGGLAALEEVLSRTTLSLNNLLGESSAPLDLDPVEDPVEYPVEDPVEYPVEDTADDSDDSLLEIAPEE